MPNPALSIELAQRAVAACDAAFASGHPAPSRRNARTSDTALSVAARKLKLPREALAHRLSRARILYGLAPAWAGQGVDAPYAGKPAPREKIKDRVEPRAKGTRVAVMTAAQDETAVHEPALAALECYAKARGGELFIGGFTYQKGLFQDHSVRTGVYSRDIMRHLRPENIDLAPRLTWHGGSNILPTAADPLSGWETQTRDKWAVFPHAKIALRCVPSMPGRPVKQIMTTGVVTRENYIERNSGQKAKFHHTIGADVAEVASDGTFFCRQIQVDGKGAFQDLDRLVSGGRVIAAPPIEAATWGDIHFECLDEAKAAASWGGPGSMLETLRPRYQFVHDSFDFTARSPHTRADPHERAMRRAEQADGVGAMLDRVAALLDSLRRPWSRVVHVASNHNVHLDKWLKDPCGAQDPANALEWHELNAAWHRAITGGDSDFLPHAHALRARMKGAAVFLREGESFTICRSTHPVECGLHGHIGPRGARGGFANLVKIVERINAAHTHEPHIREGSYWAGTSCRLDPAYARRGPGAWAHADIVTYSNGKRAIITHQNGKWRA